MKHVSEWHYQNLGVAGHMVVWWYITFGPHNTIWTNQKNSTTLHKPWSKLVWPILQKLYIIQKQSEIYEAFRSQYWRQSNYAKRRRQRRNRSCYIAQQSQIQLFIDSKILAAISTPWSPDVAIVGCWERRHSTSFFNLSQLVLRLEILRMFSMQLHFLLKTFTVTVAITLTSLVSDHTHRWLGA